MTCLLPFPQVVRGISSGARVFEYLTLEPTIPLAGGGRIPYHSLMGRVDFMNISFRLDPHLNSKQKQISDPMIQSIDFLLCIFTVIQQDLAIRS